MSRELPVLAKDCDERDRDVQEPGSEAGQLVESLLRRGVEQLHLPHGGEPLGILNDANY